MAENIQILELKAENQTEQKILDYLNENASDVLSEKINAGKKTLAGAVDYATTQARKLAKGAGSACVDDDTVFGWVVHFFEEDSVKEAKPSTKATVRTPGNVKQTTKPKDKPKPSRQIAMDLFGANAEGEAK